MKPYFIGLISIVVMTAYSQGTTNMTASAPIHVEAGRIFTVKIESNPTTGYCWQLSKALDDKIILVTNAFVPSDGKRCGAGGHEVWTFKAIEHGQTEISMKYVRPWEQDQPPARTNMLTVVVK